MSCRVRDTLLDCDDQLVEAGSRSARLCDRSDHPCYREFDVQRRLVPALHTFNGRLALPLAPLGMQDGD